MKKIPFYFEEIGNKVLVSNMLRDFLILTQEEFDLLKEVVL